MANAPETIVHATAVALDTAEGRAGVLLRGPSGSGKSDLALRLIDRGAMLVADDQTVLRRRGDTLLLAAPAAIAGRIEVRGLGIVPVDHVGNVELKLVIDLVRRASIDRLPPSRSTEMLGIAIPTISLDPFEVSAGAKVRLAVRAAGCGILHRLD